MFSIRWVILGKHSVKGYCMLFWSINVATDVPRKVLWFGGQFRQPCSTRLVPLLTHYAIKRFLSRGVVKSVDRP